MRDTLVQALLEASKNSQSFYFFEILSIFFSYTCSHDNISFFISKDSPYPFFWRLKNIALSTFNFKKPSSGGVQMLGV